jgi:hypothetical protein
MCVICGRSRPFSQERFVPVYPAPVPSHGLQRVLFSVVLLVIVLATLYATWIAISNFSRIAV